MNVEMVRVGGVGGCGGEGCEGRVVEGDGGDEGEEGEFVGEVRDVGWEGLRGAVRKRGWVCVDVRGVILGVEQRAA